MVLLKLNNFKQYYVWIADFVLSGTIHFEDFFCRKFVDGVFRFFLVGIVTGNPSTCFPKTLPDVYNFIGNQQVTKQSFVNLK